MAGWCSLVHVVLEVGNDKPAVLQGRVRGYRAVVAQHYHKRSNIETAYSTIKGKFGSHLLSKSDTGQINEALCKVLCHNVCVLIQEIHELGIEPTFWVMDKKRAGGAHLPPETLPRLALTTGEPGALT